MAQADWTFLTGVLDAQTVDRGVTAGTTPPVGGSNFVYGFNSLAIGVGAVGLFNNQVNFAPMASVSSVRGALKRAPSGGTTNFSTFVYTGWQGVDVSDGGYMLGLQDDDPSFIVLRKTQAGEGMTTGLVAGDEDPSGNGILLKSTEPVAIDTWVHLRLDMVVNGTGDVLLNVFRNNSGDVSAPQWEVIPGMTTTQNPNGFFDDTLGVNSGSAPYTSGRAGFGFQTTDVTRRAFADYLEVFRQL